MEHVFRGKGIVYVGDKIFSDIWYELTLSEERELTSVRTFGEGRASAASESASISGRIYDPDKPNTVFRIWMKSQDGKITVQLADGRYCDLLICGSEGSVVSYDDKGIYQPEETA